jgi:hypothetical protein
MATKPASPYQNPLDRFLGRKEDDYETRLDFIARQFAELPFDEGSFRRELEQKLKTFQYPQPNPRGDARTFHDILNSSGVLEILLHSDTLRELWKCLLLKKIIARDRELEKKGLAVSGHPLEFHERIAKQIYEHLGVIRDIAATYDAHELAQGLEEKIGQEFRKHMDIALHKMPKYQGSRAELLGGRSKKELPTKSWKEELVTQMEIYRTLKPKLQNTHTEKGGISGIFLCQLSELVSAAPDAVRLKNGQSLWRALGRSKP